MGSQEGSADKWEAVVEPDKHRLTYRLPFPHLHITICTSLAASAQEVRLSNRSSGAAALRPDKFPGYTSSWLIQHGFDPARIAAAEQVHGADVLYVRDARVYRNCDGFYTDQPGLPLLIRTADCAAVFAVLPAVPAIGVVHAGWRGAAGGIVSTLVKEMAQHWNARPSDFWVAVSPHIRSCCYEVGPEFNAYFPKAFLVRRNNRFHLDLSGFLAHQIEELGIPDQHYFISNECTACSSLPLYSYRRQKTTRRLANLIQFR